MPKQTIELTQASSEATLSQTVEPLELDCLFSLEDILLDYYHVITSNFIRNSVRNALKLRKKNNEEQL